MVLFEDCPKLHLTTGFATLQYTISDVGRRGWISNNEKELFVEFANANQYIAPLFICM